MVSDTKKVREALGIRDVRVVLEAPCRGGHPMFVAGQEVRLISGSTTLEEVWRVRSREDIPERKPYILEALEAEERRQRIECEGQHRECTIPTVNGESLRFPSWDADHEGCGYVRIVDKDGNELLYWDSQEWAEDPKLVMGSILGAVLRGGS